MWRTSGIIVETHRGRLPRRTTRERRPPWHHDISQYLLFYYSVAEFGKHRRMNTSETKYRRDKKKRPIFAASLHGLGIKYNNDRKKKRLNIDGDPHRTVRMDSEWRLRQWWCRSSWKTMEEFRQIDRVGTGPGCTRRRVWPPPGTTTTTTRAIVFCGRTNGTPPPRPRVQAATHTTDDRRVGPPPPTGNSGLRNAHRTRWRQRRRGRETYNLANDIL